MTKTYKLSGLDCANCANKIEDRVRKISGVSEVSVNFISCKLRFEAEEAQMERIEQEVHKVIRKVDADVVAAAI